MKWYPIITLSTFLLNFSNAVTDPTLILDDTKQLTKYLIKKSEKSSIINPKFELDYSIFETYNAEKDNEDKDCPPCFNCNLPNFECTQFSTCNTFTGMCECQPGYGGLDCSEPLCGSLSKGNNKRPIRKKDSKCDCESGWSGINCNLCERDDVCDSFMPEGIKGTCYKQGIIVNQFHQMCNVTNSKILKILDGKIPQATFSCNKTSENCNFQFWIDQKESFYCDLNKCKLNYDLSSNKTKYNCETIACKCLPDRMLCGEKGSIDISDFLTETIKGPGDFSCELNDQKCRFSEPSMNDLIQSVFGDPYITLECKSGECIHKSEIPGCDFPKDPKLTLGNIFVIIGVLVVCLLFVITIVRNINDSALFKKSDTNNDGDYEELPTDSNSSLLLNSNFEPTTLSFENINYKVNNKDNKNQQQQVLNNIFGLVKPRECLAIMGGSGAGKTTLLDILAGKNKDGEISGSIYINGNKLDKKHYKEIVGFVDQEDHLIPTLTVYETVLNSALLRLPRSMTFQQKQSRVIEVLNELRIIGIKDRVIGSNFKRGISGGEKRRVSIACELVTSPSILFLDEPTSGLDSYNARNVIDCLVKLSRDYNRTIIFTIHQPRSNIVSLFDKLILLSDGDLIFSGDMIKANDFFTKNGYKCPLGYNIADYLIDITVDHNKILKVSNIDSNVISATSTDLHSGSDHPDIHQDFITNRSSSQVDTTQEWEHFAVHRDEYNTDIIGSKKLENGEEETLIRLRNKLHNLFIESSLAGELINEINEGKEHPLKFDLKKHDIFKKANIVQQISILSSRIFKNLYRNPRLLFAHYLLSLIMGLFCGYLYYNVKNDISGFQNRLGFFFFILAFFGFSSLTGLHSFATERIIFVRERANNYYNPLSYYLSKIICDIIPLRVLPPILLISIAYPLVGLTMEHNAFLKSIMVLVLFTVAVSIEMLIVGILIKEPGTSTMIGVLLLLLSLLFAGLFINSQDLTTQIKWLEWISVFHYAYEALSINEVKDLMLKEKKFGLSIEVPGAVILSTFGFKVGAFWHDVWYLSGLSVVFLILGYIFLYYYTFERR
ncbi:ADP1 [Candida pseudojiufengensis]|uniref:ADP1 n=1 Tax=Candida pseudojiufengensis TaxID=497109 RepID=UPI002224E37F|nr:ADP1 [Candida pseudojiufengensis]KAI5962532.1 ADP1 [Candida pseudojiufengensis]